MSVVAREQGDETSSYAKGREALKVGATSVAEAVRVAKNSEAITVALASSQKAGGLIGRHRKEPKSKID
ncbi:unnamed protein product [Parascedosporium putredinis]|uniref:Uncharacterized protein n=1 Tax=Parascedosporium putredinis TaxID=1442378 RepID=A0A9P1M820_9PEZI|nr:unnamed protein product [Parascedosporium putredinis]CAI7991725.1 unnamed protein product [Parascedosporium putredinis]